MRRRYYTCTALLQGEQILLCDSGQSQTNAFKKNTGQLIFRYEPKTIIEPFKGSSNNFDQDDDSDSDYEALSREQVDTIFSERDALTLSSLKGTRLVLVVAEALHQRERNRALRHPPAV